MSKTFYVITEEYYEERYINEKNVLYAFETQEEALYVLHLLEEESANGYSYDLSIVNNNHPYEKLSEEEMLRMRRERDAHKRAKAEMEKQKEYVKLSQNRIMKIQNEKIQNDINKRKAEEKKQEREQECQGYKEKIDKFMDWLQNARNYIATYEPKEEQEQEQEDKEEYEYNSQYSSDHYEEDEDNKYVMTPTDYEYEVKYKLSLIKNEIQEYLLDYQDERVMELVNKPVYELLNLPAPLTCYQTPSIYIPKRLRQVMEQDKKK